MLIQLHLFFHLSAVVAFRIKLNYGIERFSVFFYFNNKAVSSIFLLYRAKRIV